MDRIRTATGRSLRDEGLHETVIPIPYDAAAMPGAVLLASDGRAYQSMKDGATYQWRRLVAETVGNQVVIGSDQPQTRFLIFLGDITSTPITPRFQVQGIGHGESSMSLIRTGNDNDPSRVFLGKQRVEPLTPQPPNEFISSIHFVGVDGFSSDLISGGTISARAESGGTIGHVPMRIVVRTRPVGVGPTDLLERVAITSDGKVRINNTIGTEILSITGNVQLTDSSNYFTISGSQVVGSRKTGWTAATGTSTRTTFDTTTVTTAQLAERVKALVDDLISHGLIGE